MTQTLTLTDGHTVTLRGWTLAECVQHARGLEAAVARLTAPLRGLEPDDTSEATFAQLRAAIVPCLGDPSDAGRLLVADLPALLDAVARANALPALLGTAVRLQVQFAEARAVAAAP